MSNKSVLTTLLLCVLCVAWLDVCSARAGPGPSTSPSPSSRPIIPSIVRNPEFQTIAVTTRQQYLQKTGRIRWAAEEKTEMWTPQSVGIIVVDMWDRHWCPSATERVQSLAMIINNTINMARSLGVQIIHAPSECDEYYVNHTSRRWTLALPNITMPDPIPQNVPDFPIGTDGENAGCDVPGAIQYAAWTHETDLITIHPQDALIEDSDNGQTLWNLVVYRGLKYILYLGVHENMCIMNRSFAIKVTSGWPLEIAVTREATDTMYEPSQYPYCTHETSVNLMTQYIEKWWGKSISVYDFLNPRNSTAH